MKKTPLRFRKHHGKITELYYAENGMKFVLKSRRVPATPDNIVFAYCIDKLREQIAVACRLPKDMLFAKEQ